MKGFCFLPLGGAGEIGMNLNMYGFNDQWIIVDMGVSFGDDVFSSIEAVMANPKFAVENKEKLLGLVVTHGHEDHIGAIPHIWPMLKCPIYATPFTADMIKRKLVAEGFQEAEIPIHIMPLESTFDVGPFQFTYVTLTHSIPEPNALIIKTEVGSVFHTGDWKFDPDPVIGKKTDYDQLKKIGDQGVLALVGDSTNALSEGVSGSEGKVQDELPALFENCDGKIVVTCFASNLARLLTIIRLAEKVNRRVVLMGGSLLRMTDLAREHGIFKDIPPFLSEDEMCHVADKDILVICTGSQGEPRAALTRAARDIHPRFHLKDKDRVIFSSKRIPGNERSISSLYNNLIRKGVEVITEGDHFVHVSGHPSRDELRQMYKYIRPTYAIPVHGELMHMKAHCELAESEGVVEAVLVENGDVVRLDPDEICIEDHVDTGRWVVDEKRLLPREDPIIQKRRRMSYKGYIHVSVVIDSQFNLIKGPYIHTPGVFEKGIDQDIIDGLGQEVSSVFDTLSQDNVKVNQVEDTVRHRLKYKLRQYGIVKPFMDIHFITL